MTVTRMLCGVALTACSAVVLACEMPALIVIPSSTEIAGDAQALQAEWAAYAAGMKQYVECTQAALQAAGGDGAPALTRALLVKRNNDAVAEVAAMAKLYERLAPLATQEPAPTTLDLPRPQ